MSDIGAAAIERVYSALTHEADLEGVVTATGERLGQLAGVSGSTARLAIRELTESGRIEVTGRTGVRFGVTTVRLLEVSA